MKVIALCTLALAALAVQSIQAGEGSGFCRVDPLVRRRMVRRCDLRSDGPPLRLLAFRRRHAAPRCHVLACRLHATRRRGEVGAPGAGLDGRRRRNWRPGGLAKFRP